jgi:hypothetical protein
VFSAVDAILLIPRENHLYLQNCSTERREIGLLDGRPCGAIEPRWRVASRPGTSL